MPLQFTPYQEQEYLRNSGYDPETNYIEPATGQILTKQKVQPSVATPEVTVQQPIVQAKPESSPFWAGARSFARRLIPSGAGAGVGMAAAALAPETGGLSLLALPLAIGGGLLGSTVAEKAQEAVMPEAWKQQLAEDAQQHPVSTQVGQIASAAPFFGPSVANVLRSGKTAISLGKNLIAPGEATMPIPGRDIANLVNVGLGGAIGTGSDIGQDLSQGKPIDVQRAILSGLGGMLMNKPTKPFIKAMGKVGINMEPNEGFTPDLRKGAEETAQEGEPIYKEAIRNYQNAVKAKYLEEEPRGLRAALIRSEQQGGTEKEIAQRAFDIAETPEGYATKEGVRPRTFYSETRTEPKSGKEYYEIPFKKIPKYDKDLVPGLVDEKGNLRPGITEELFRRKLDEKVHGQAFEDYQNALAEAKYTNEQVNARLEAERKAAELEAFNKDLQKQAAKGIRNRYTAEGQHRVILPKDRAIIRNLNYKKWKEEYNKALRSGKPEKVEEANKYWGEEGFMERYQAEKADLRSYPFEPEKQAGVTKKTSFTEKNVEQEAPRKEFRAYQQEEGGLPPESEFTPKVELGGTPPPPETPRTRLKSSVQLEKDIADYNKLIEEHNKGLEEGVEKVKPLSRAPTTGLFGFFQKHLGPLRNVNIEADGTITDKVTGKPVKGVALLKKGIQDRIAKINPFRATLDTVGHEPMHWFLHDLENSPHEGDRNLVNRFYKAVKNSSEFKRINADRVARGEQPLSPNEIGTEGMGNKIADRILNLQGMEGTLKRSWEDLLSRIRIKWGKAGIKDFENLISNRFFHDPSYFERFISRKDLAAHLNENIKEKEEEHANKNKQTSESTYNETGENQEGSLQQLNEKQNNQQNDEGQASRVGQRRLLKEEQNENEQTNESEDYEATQAEESGLQQERPQQRIISREGQILKGQKEEQVKLKGGIVGHPEETVEKQGKIGNQGGQQLYEEGEQGLKPEDIPPPPSNLSELIHGKKNPMESKYINVFPPGIQETQNRILNSFKDVLAKRDIYREIDVKNKLPGFLGEYSSFLDKSVALPEKVATALHESMHRLFEHARAPKMRSNSLLPHLDNELRNLFNFTWNNHRFNDTELRDLANAFKERGGYGDHVKALNQIADEYTMTNRYPIDVNVSKVANGRDMTDAKHAFIRVMDEAIAQYTSNDIPKLTPVFGKAVERVFGKDFIEFFHPEIGGVKHEKYYPKYERPGEAGLKSLNDQISQASQMKERFMQQYNESKSEMDRVGIRDKINKLNGIVTKLIKKRDAIRKEPGYYFEGEEQGIRPEPEIEIEKMNALKGQYGHPETLAFETRKTAELEAQALREKEPDKEFYVEQPDPRYYKGPSAGRGWIVFSRPKSHAATEEKDFIPFQHFQAGSRATELDREFKQKYSYDAQHNLFREDFATFIDDSRYEKHIRKVLESTGYIPKDSNKPLKAYDFKQYLDGIANSGKDNAISKKFYEEFPHQEKYVKESQYDNNEAFYNSIEQRIHEINWEAPNMPDETGMFGQRYHETNRVDPKRIVENWKYFRQAVYAQDPELGFRIDQYKHYKGPSNLGHVRYEGEEQGLKPEEGQLQEGSYVAGADTLRAMDIFGAGMYDKKPAATVAKEAIQNASDSFKPGQTDKKIYAGRLGNDNMYFADNGKGMTPSEVITKLLPAFVSGKTGAESRGSFGLAKIALLGSPEEWNVKTIANVEGKNLQTEISGNPENWKKFVSKGYKMDFNPTEPGVHDIHGMKIEIKEMPDNVNTGTLYTAKLPDYYSGVDQTKKMLADVAKDFDVSYNRFYGSNLQLEQALKEGDKAFLDTYQLSNKLQTLESHKVPGANIEIKALSNKGGHTGYIPVFNRGLRQFELPYYKDVKLPEGISIEVTPTVGVEDANYPYTTNRDNLKGEAKTKVEEVIESFSELEKRRQIQMFNNVKNNSMRITGTQTKFLDLSNNVPEDVKQRIVNSPALQQLAKIMKPMIRNMLNYAGQRKGQENFKNADFTGFTSGGGFYGVRFGTKSPSDPSQIYFDPFLIADKASQAVASGMYHPDEFPLAFAESISGTAVHEIAHQINHSEGEYHAEAMTDLAGTLQGIGFQYEKKIVNALNKLGADNVHRELTHFYNELLQYENKEIARSLVGIGRGEQHAKRTPTSNIENGPNIESSTGGYKGTGNESTGEKYSGTEQGLEPDEIIGNLKHIENAPEFQKVNPFKRGLRELMTSRLPIFGSDISKLEARQGKSGKMLGQGLRENFANELAFEGKYLNPSTDIINKLNDNQLDNLYSVLLAEKRQQKFMPEALKDATTLDAYKRMRELIKQKQIDQKNDDQWVQDLNTGEFRPPKVDPYYVPEIVGGKQLDILLNASDSEAFNNLKRDFIKFQSKAYDIPEDKATDMFNDLIASYGGPGAQKGDITHFGAVRRSEGVGLPDSWLERDFATAMRRYWRRVAKDRAFYNSIEKDPNLLYIMGRKRDARGGPVKPTEEGLTPMGGNAELGNIMDIVQGRAVKANPVIDALSRIASNAVLGPVTGITDLINAAPILSKFIPSPAHIPGYLKSVLNLRQGIKDAVSTGRIKENTTAIGDMTYPRGDFVEKLRDVGNMVSKINTREYLERYSRGLSQALSDYLITVHKGMAETGNQESKNLLTGLANGKDYKQLSHKELASRLLELGQGTYDPRGLPAWAIDSQIAPLFRLAKWNIEQLNTLHKHVLLPLKDGNFKPLFMTMAGGLIGGYLAKEVRERLNNKKQPVPQWAEILSSSRGLKGNIPSAAYNLAAATSYSGVTGLLGDGVKAGFDVAFKNTPQGFNYPLIELVGDTGVKIAQAADAMVNGESPMDVIPRLLSDLASEHIQLGRIAKNQLSRFDKGDRSAEDVESRRNLRAYKMVEGQEYAPQGLQSAAENPYVDLRAKSFKHRRLEELPEAANETQELVKQVLTEGKNPDEIKRKLLSLKRNNFQTIPSPTSNVREFANFTDFNTRVRGQADTNKRINRYLEQTQANKVKAKFIP